jgi:hypothetical protein
MATVAEFDHQPKALLRRHARVCASVGLIGLLKTREDPDRFLH